MEYYINMYKGEQHPQYASTLTYTFWFRVEIDQPRPMAIRIFEDMRRKYPSPDYTMQLWERQPRFSDLIRE